MFILIIIFCYSPIISQDYVPLKEEVGHEKQSIKKENESIISPPETATYWPLNDFHLVINDTDSNSNWIKINKTYDWCSGKGTFNKPFVIENISINGAASGIGIEILNSNVSYFTLKNTRISNASIGIKLYNTSRGFFINNTCFNNSQKGFFLEDSFNNTLIRNNISQNGMNRIADTFGIYLLNSKNNTIYHNNVSSNSAKNNCFGIYLINSNSNNITKNTVNKNKARSCSGIRLKNSNNTIVFKNIAANNDLSGICFGNCKNCTFSENKIVKGGFLFESPPFHLNILDKTNLVNGNPLHYYINKTKLTQANFSNPGQIFLYNCNDSIITGMDIYNSTNGLWIENSNNISIGYCNFSCNLYSGLYLKNSNNFTISNSFFRDNDEHGLYFWSTINLSIKTNIFKHNPKFGIYGNSENNSLVNNLFERNGEAASVSGENYTILSNIASNNIASFSIFADNCTIRNNTAKDSASYGFKFYGKNSVLRNNTAIYNKNEGFYIRYDDNELSDNIINHNENGIIIHGSSNKIFENSLQSNEEYGILADSFSSNNMVYGNSLSGNGINALDDGTENVWYNGNKGNLWGDYNGKDYDDNGIGDTSYPIEGDAGVMDKYPIYYDGPDPPSLELLAPASGGLFGADPPAFIIKINDASLSTSWYLITDGIYTSPKCFFKSNESIKETEWSEISDGILTLIFYANDTLGNENHITIEIFKDSAAPVIVVASPSVNGTFGRNAPAFNVIITDANLHTCWYSISGWEQNFTFTSNGTFYQKAWESIWALTKNGDFIIISFYANDSLGNENFITIYLEKHPDLVLNQLEFAFIILSLILSIIIITGFYRDFFSKSFINTIKSYIMIFKKSEPKIILANLKSSIKYLILYRSRSEYRRRRSEK